MKDKIKTIVADSLSDLNITIDDAQIIEKDGLKYLEIALDSEEMLDAHLVNEAAKIIDPLIDEADLIEETYILDIYAKSKGDDENE